MHFPQPVTIGGSARWNLNEVQSWEKSHGLDLPPPKGMMSVRQLAERYSVSVSTVWRWAAKSRAAA